MAIFCGAFLFATPAGAYSVLSHEEVVDMAWKDHIIPMMRARFPGISDDDLRIAHSYAYGGSVIQDLGYYPFGSHYFSDLLHYVRPEDFVTNLIRDSKTPDEYAFALGALAHYCGDTVGHPAINKVTADENPKLGDRYGNVVTYAENPTAHVRTEFGFDVVEVAQGHYSQQNYRDFVGFQVAKPLMNQAFEETYGIPVTEVLKHEDLAIGSYRRAVSSLIPEMTKIAFVRYKKEIQQAAPGTQKRKFLYRLNKTEYQKDFGTDAYHISFGGRVLAFFLSIVPKVGPFKALKVSLPNPQDQVVYLKSINDTVDKFEHYLTEIHAAPAPLPPPDPKDVAATQKAAEQVAKDAGKAQSAAAKEQDPAEKAKLEQAAAHVERAATKISAAATEKQATVTVGQASVQPPVPGAAEPVAAGMPIEPPTTPVLPNLDLDTGNPSAAGEYILADDTYARLLHDLVTSGTPAAASAKVPKAATGDLKATDSKPVDPKIAADLEHFFAAPVACQRGSPVVEGCAEAGPRGCVRVQVRSDYA